MSATTLPSLDRYSEAVQNPKTVFFDPILKAGTVDKTGLGIPRALGGGLVVTFSLRSGSRRYAVRCFHKNASGLQERYAAIGASLRQSRLPCFVDFDYQPQGIRVDSTNYPIVRMDWVEGETLGRHLDTVHSNGNRLSELLKRFREIEALLRANSIAHGDIQNSNVMLRPDGGLMLIDYDGMYVPGMRGPGAELGHRHFQHPGRKPGNFGPGIDRFSFILVDLSLQALIEKPSLFGAHSNGDNILFEASDLQDPATSPVFAQLQGIPALKAQAAAFASICAADVKSVPTLEDFLGGRNIPSAAIILRTFVAGQTARTAAYIGAHPVIDASAYRAALAFVGDAVEIVGRIHEVKIGETRHGGSFIFINFDDWHSDGVRAVIWPEGLSRLKIFPDASWKGSWISVTGLLTPYHAKKHGRHYVDVEIRDPASFRRIDEIEARRRLAGGKGSSSPKSGQGGNAAKLAALTSGATGGTKSRSASPGTARQSVPAGSRNQQILAGLKGSPKGAPVRASNARQSPPSAGRHGSAQPTSPSQTPRPGFRIRGWQLVALLIGAAVLRLIFR